MSASRDSKNSILAKTCKVFPGDHVNVHVQVLRALLWLQQVWERTFLQERLVDTGLEALELPCKVEDFCEIEVSDVCRVVSVMG